MAAAVPGPDAGRRRLPALPRRPRRASSASTWPSCCPYNLARTWHVQLAIFWVATSFLAAGIFLAPMIAGREPTRQHWLAYGLLAALAVVVFGSLIGEFGRHPRLARRRRLGRSATQGFEYLDLGRFWQVLLSIGLFFWVGDPLPRPARRGCDASTSATCPGCSSSPRWRSRRSTPSACSPRRTTASPSPTSGASGSCTCGSRTSSSCSRRSWSPTSSCCSASCASASR